MKVPQSRLDKPVRMWALLNFERVLSVAYLRRDCVYAGKADFGPSEYGRCIRIGSLKLSDRWAKAQIVAVLIGGGLAVVVTALKWIVG